MRFWVKVPVLSKQSTWTEPKVSIAASLRTSTPFSRIRPIPSASVVVATAGRPSGSAATASETAVLSIGKRPRPRRRPIPKIPTHTPALRRTSWRPSVSSRCCKGVGGGATLPKSAWIRPASLAAPVATTIARPRPPVTTLPRKTRFTRSAIGTIGSASASTPFRTGKLSPVSALSSTASPSTATSRPSAAIGVPGSSSSRSPRTISSAATRCGRPSRITSAGGGSVVSRLAMIRSARLSVYQPIVALAATTARITTASARPPVRRETPAETARSPTGSETSWSLRIASSERRCGGGRLFGPSRARRARAFSAERPRSGSVPRRAATSSAESRCQAQPAGGSSGTDRGCSGSEPGAGASGSGSRSSSSSSQRNSPPRSRPGRCSTRSDPVSGLARARVTRSCRAAACSRARAVRVQPLSPATLTRTRPGTAVWTGVLRHEARRFAGTARTGLREGRVATARLAVALRRDEPTGRSRPQQGLRCCPTRIVNCR